jgi:hypothetical protein
VTRPVQHIRHRRRCPFWARADAPVWYETQPGTRFPAFIDGNPWFATGEKAWYARLRDVRTSAGTLAIASAGLLTLVPRIVRDSDKGAPPP